MSHSHNRSAHRSFFTASLLLLAVNNLASVLNYAFQAMMKRSLSDADYGLMNSLFFLAGLLAIPATIYANALTRRWAEWSHGSRGEEADRAWRALMLGAAGLAVAVTLLTLPLVPLMAWWLKTTNLRAVVVTVCFSGVGVVLGLAAPLATARQWFGLLAAGSFAGALLRIAIGWQGACWGMPLSGAVAASSVSGIALVLIVAWKVKRGHVTREDFRSLHATRAEWISSAAMSLSLFFILQSDLLVVKRFFEPEPAGHFAQVMVLGKIICFLIGPISVVLFPKSVAVEGAVPERRVVRRALGLGALILVAAAAAFQVLAPFAVELLRGRTDPELLVPLAGYLRMAAWCLIPLSLCQLVVPALFARRQERHLLEFTALAALVPIGIALFGRTIEQVFAIEGIVGLLLLGFIAFRLRRRS